MEGNKHSAAASSFASDLFGAHHSSPPPHSSSGIFCSTFPNPAADRASGGESLRLSEPEKKNPLMNQPRSSKPQLSSNDAVTTKSHDFNPYYQEQNPQPFHYSSSIYYGGQDIYSQPNNAQNPNLTTFCKETGDDDKGAVSRGNWWKGSLYY